MRSNRVRTTVLATGALLAALSLTACGSDAGSGNDSAKAGAAAPAAHSTAEPSTPPAAAPEKDATGTDTDGTTTGSAPKRITPPAETEAKKSAVSTPRKPSAPDRTPVTCTGGNTKTVVSKASRPINHLLLTVTNTGDRPCYAYYAPKLRFDDAQAVFPILESSRPQAVVTLDPGRSAYAAIGLTGEPGTGPAPRRAAHLQVNFSGRNAAGSTGAPTELTLPARTYWDDNGYVTYWQTEMADALTF
ncbi:DUF4232 domain-containing protein [Streptomyces sp. A0642]|uniref:DUF4232 domain-containing protein n=1 Tax=Streptomyces sp. A0642 TaxID=2563100 RepID=UPI0010A29D11|nr:DUF4232 domain-containing protein [Streptomyces sp. A0642]THA62186.1 DUF4232 domain-containing protein [Streptomyces sp. A0642]